MSLEESQARYRAAMHAVQSGVAAKMEYDGGETSPKQLRVGVNSAMVEFGALAGLLMRKGVISEEEFHEALADAAEAEQRLYERWLSERTGAHIRLG